MVTLQSFVLESNYHTLQGSSTQESYSITTLRNLILTVTNKQQLLSSTFPWYCLLYGTRWYQLLSLWTLTQPKTTQKKNIPSETPAQKRSQVSSDGFYTTQAVYVGQHLSALLSAVSQRFFLLRFLGCCLFEPWFRSSLGGLN